MFGTLITLGLGAYLFGSAVADSSKTMENKNEACRGGEPYYVDSKFKKRSTQTNEILTENFESSNHNGHHVLIGVNSKRVYHDYTTEAHKKANDKLREEGKRFYWKEYNGVHGPGENASSRKPSYWAYDPEKGSAYQLEFNMYRMINHSDKRYIKRYIKPNNMLYPYMEQNKNLPCEYMTDEEAEPWSYGCRPSF